MPATWPVASSVVRLGIHSQVLLSLGFVLTVTFVPLYLGVASLARASIVAARREAARDLGRAIAAPVLDRRTATPLEERADRQLSDGAVLALGVYEGRAARVRRGDLGLLPVALGEATSAGVEELPSARAMRVTIAGASSATAIVVLAIDPFSAFASPLVDLVAVSLLVLAFALLALAYLSISRLVVRPVDAIVEAAGRVALGDRNVVIPTRGPEELARLGASVREMMQKLRHDEEALRARADEAEKARKTLESTQATLVRSEKLASVGRLAAGMAHEIGNPLAALLGFEDLLLQGGLEPDEQRDFLQRMKRETERIHRVLRDLLDFARPREALGGKGGGDVATAVNTVVGLLAPQKDLRNVELVQRVGEALPKVALSEERLEQVLLNLVLNAVDAVPSGAGRIEVRATHDPSADVIVLEVEDNGPGIPPSVRERLFEPFFSTKEPGKGTGLGLAVGRGLVEAAGGTLVAKEETSGACFEVRLPCATDEALAGEAHEVIGRT